MPDVQSIKTVRLNSVFENTNADLCKIKTKYSAGETVVPESRSQHFDSTGRSCVLETNLEVLEVSIAEAVRVANVWANVSREDKAVRQ